MGDRYNLFCKTCNQIKDLDVRFHDALDLVKLRQPLAVLHDAMAEIDAGDLELKYWGSGNTAPLQWIAMHASHDLRVSREGGRIMKADGADSDEWIDWDKVER